MRMKAVIAVSVALISVLAVLQLASEADADDGDVWYCYTYEMSFFYDGGTENPSSVDWDVSGLKDGQTIELGYTGPNSNDQWWSIYLDSTQVAGCDEVYVTQTVMKDGSAAQETNTYRPVVDLSGGEYIYVTFFDGYSGSVVDVSAISSSTVVRAGDDFVDLPGAPTRDGYSFLGWYTEDGQRFDPKQPITGDTDLYARWMESSGGSINMGTVNVGAHVVTFVTPDGMVHDVVSVGDSSIEFALNVLEDYYYDMGTVRVESDRGTITDNGSTYTLSGINGDTIVTVSGDRIYRVLIETSNVDVVPTYGTGMDYISDQPFDATLVIPDGYRLTNVTVMMGTENVTDQVLDGDRIHLDGLTGNLRIVASAEPIDDGGFPWIYIVIALIVVIAVLAFVAYRRRSAA